MGRLGVWLALLVTGAASAGVRWEFDGSVKPEGAPLVLAQGTPKFAAAGDGQGLAPGCALSWADAPELRLRPDLEIRCRFRLDEMRDGTQILVMKEGEYMLRVDWQREGGHLSCFVQVDGIWEPRVRGPVVQTGVWYEVAACWTGTELTLTANGETSAISRAAGRTQSKGEPLRIGPIAGVIDRVEVRSPGYDRSAALARLTAPAAEVDRHEFGGEGNWQGWQGLGGATCESRGTALAATFPSASAMLVSPPLACELTALPFVCLTVDAPGPGWSGRLEVVTDEGTGSIAFQPLGDGRTTFIAGSLCDAWTGTLRRLALSFSGGKGTVVVNRLLLADRLVGAPWFYIQDLAPGRAKLRPGREEAVIACIKNLGGEIETGVAVRLRVPPGVELLGPETHTIPYLGRGDLDLVRWPIRAAQAGTYTVRVEVSGAGAQTQGQDLALLFEPLPDLPRADYVPAPQAATTDYINLMHYCALWKEGTHYGWKLIEPWPSRRPAIGWYDEGSPEVADWHIKYALEHGINGFIYCWYRANLEPKIEQRLGHAIDEGLLHAKYRDRFTFSIMWENAGSGVADANDLLDNLLPFWIEHYFTHPSYLKVDNIPVLFVYLPGKMMAQLGGAEGTRQAFARMREQCRAAGLGGLRLVACLSGPDATQGALIAETGWDAVTGYMIRPDVKNTGVDPDGIEFRDYASVIAGYKETWEARDRSTGAVPDIPNVVMGWDTRPWGRARRGGYVANPTAEIFARACRDAKALVDAKPADRWDRKLVVFDNWTEFGEGHYIEPTSGQGFSFLNAIKQVFCTAWAPETVTDIVPEDVGLAPPERRYAEVRAGYGSRLPWQPRRFTGDLLAHWQFESEADGATPDLSPNGCDLRLLGVRREDGRDGMALRCGEGGASCPATAEFYPLGGISVAFWAKPTEAEENGAWMINTVSDGRSGYRLGLSKGRPYWQVPRENWSHGLLGPDPLPAGEWSHIAATFDNRTMRLYIDGREVSTLERHGYINPGRLDRGVDVVVGAYSPTRPDTCFRGWMDDVRIYRRVLSAAEIAALAGGR